MKLRPERKKRLILEIKESQVGVYFFFIRIHHLLSCDLLGFRIQAERKASYRKEIYTNWPLIKGQGTCE